MKKGQSESSEPLSKRNQYAFAIDQQRSIVISSNFENGNICLVKQINELNYVLEAVSDMENLGNKKCWFHFKVRAEKGIKIRLTIQNVNILENLYEEGAKYKPMMKEGQDGQWQESSDSFLTYRDEVVLIIEHIFKNYQEVFFCLTVPFTYQDNEQYLSNLKKFVHQNINYSDQIFCLTPNQHKVHLITITEFKEDGVKRKEIGNRQQKKPIVLITARVHPGEVSSSYCLQGIMDLLLSYHNLQAYLLRRLFIFKIIPMLNPDGVVEGNYRADPQGFNLNRFYLDPDPQQHPAIYNIMELIKSSISKQKIQFYYDLHSHSSIKESFIYGNAFDDLVSQTYSELYCKILEENFPRFRCYLSNFGENHMKHKDKGQSLSKEGCGRVVISKVCGFPCSYTVESSIFPSSYEMFLKKEVKTEQANRDFTRLSSPSQEIYYFEPMYSLNQHNQNIIVAENKRLGKAIMISILDMLEKNPYSRLKEGFNDNYFKQKPGKLLANEERFKLMDIKAYTKAKNMSQYVKNKFENPLDKQWNLSGVAMDINQGSWPPQFRLITSFADLGIFKVYSQTKLKKIRMNTQGRDKNVIPGSLVKKNDKNAISSANKDQNIVDSHRSISPQPNGPTRTIFPEIKYSVEMKLTKKETLGLKISSKEISLYKEDESEMKNGPKKVLLDYINDQISKLSPQKQTLRRNSSSLNRMIANKILDAQKSKKKGSQLNAYKNMIIAESRKRISTQIKEEQIEKTEENKHQERYTMSEDQIFKALQLKKADAIKKRVILNNKAVEILRKSDRPKLKLPEVTRITLVVENSIKEKTIHTEGSQPCLPFQKHK